MSEKSLSQNHGPTYAVLKIYKEVEEAIPEVLQ